MGNRFYFTNAASDPFMVTVSTRIVTPTPTRVPGPTPTPTRIDVLTPTLTPIGGGSTPTATPKPISLKPVDLLMKFEQLPLPGFDPNRVEDYVSQGSTGVDRLFVAGDVQESGGYSYFGLYVEIVTTSEAARAWVSGRNCSSWASNYPNGTGSELTVRSLGDGAKACRVLSTQQGTQSTYLIVFASTRNAEIYTSTTTGGITESEVLETLASLAERQTAIIDQLSPPGPVMQITTGQPRFTFNTPATLPNAEAGKPYRPNGQSFSFCDPPTIGFTTQCPPPGTTARNPSGGNPPYHFQYGTMGGFPPFGMALGKDGQLTGTPHRSTSGKTYKFVVCAVDLSADFVCREVTLTVTGLAVTPTPTFTPTRTPMPQVTTAGTIASLSCTWTPQPNDPRMVGTWSYDASGTVTGKVGDVMNFARKLDGVGNSLSPQTLTSGWAIPRGFGPGGDARERASSDPQTANWSIRGTQYGGNATTFELVLQVNGLQVASRMCQR